MSLTLALESWLYPPRSSHSGRLLPQEDQREDPMVLRCQKGDPRALPARPALEPKIEPQNPKVYMGGWRGAERRVRSRLLNPLQERCKRSTCAGQIINFVLLGVRLPTDAALGLSSFGSRQKKPDQAGRRGAGRVAFACKVKQSYQRRRQNAGRILGAPALQSISQTHRPKWMRKGSKDIE